MVSRRRFMQLASVGASLVAGGASPLSAGAATGDESGNPPVDQLVALTGDNVPRKMTDAPAQLLRMLETRSGMNDFYLAEGAVAALELEFSRLLGKESAVFMPTGTMANQIAIRLLCGDRRRLLVQRESHVYQDEGDAASTLSGINPVPLETAGPDLEQQLQAAFSMASESPYPTTVGAVSLESPIRRLDGRTLPLEQVERISALVKRQGAGLHLDGARLLLMHGSAGFEAARYCKPFDTVYVSLYKYLGAPFGAVLAGGKDMMEKAREMRHVLGGTLFHGWVAALPALEQLDGFGERFARAREAGEQLLAALSKIDGITVERVPDGSNIAFLQLGPRLADGLAERLRAHDIVIANVRSGRLPLTINETILRRPVAEIAAAFPPRSGT
ncbi:beta-eliminating lyase-related protein [Pseudoxanthomonas sp.]|uniref:threonine aldolase family protein n=1 Tax=Pseudoxanthomonas sp. TaxID=1871049 RepID=UPI002628B956|nr:beta-eliminating lyase-related protein [Pseudoxanthomonas sp.]WDS34718.1 MAG: beta-eliminating lyase-related protein [Pseudoxanthomonas sp.]